MFDSSAGLISLREKSNKSPDLISMLRSYKVPIQMSDDEVDKVNQYFDQIYQKDKKWYQFWKKKKNYKQSYDNKHSRVMYLMGTDNKFLQFYDVDIELDELTANVKDEISYDIGIRYLGTGSRPITRA